MIIKILLKYILGYIHISIEGYYIERFINLCRKENIILWNIKRKTTTQINANVGVKEYRKIVKICKQIKCKVKIHNKKGLRFLLYKYKKRKIFFWFIILLAILLGITSNFIWNIEIKSDEQFEGIMQDLKEAGVYVGTSKKNIEIKQVISDVQLKRQDIAWMGIEQKGTNLIVKIVKATEKPEIEENESNNIVANKTGIISKVTAKNGSIRVQEGQLVKEGDILIEGVMEGLYTEARLVPARGEVEARVWYTETKKVPLKCIRKEETGEEENKYTIKIKDFSINLFKSVAKFEFYDTIEEENKIKLFQNFYLPISIIKTKNREQIEIEKNYTIEEAKALGIQELFEEIEKNIEGKTEKKENIVNKNVTAKINKENVEVTVTYEVIQNIGEKDQIVN